MKKLVVLCALLTACTAFAADPYQAEYIAYTEFLKDQHRQGHLSRAEVLSLAQGKANELNARRATNSAAATALTQQGLQIMQQNRPAFVPQGSNCTAITQGAYTNTHCR